MIEEQKCQTIREQSVLDYELLFKDPEFGPDTRHNPVYFDGDLEAKLANEIEFSLKKLQWLRPQQISQKPKLAGFNRIDFSLASEEERESL